MNIPIFQMAYGQNDENEYGLIFPSEIKGEIYTEPIFTIPLAKEYITSKNLMYYIASNSFSIFILLQNKLIKIKAENYFPLLIFKIPGMDLEIAFELDLKQPYSFSNNKFLYDNYVGSSNLIPENLGFVKLICIDMLEIDYFYEEFKGVVLGLTPRVIEFYQQNTQDL